jgi:hypothetical protein
MKQVAIVIVLLLLAGAGQLSRGGSMERWFIVGLVIMIFLALGAAGWHFEQTSQSATDICASADAHCGERRL